MLEVSRVFRSEIGRNLAMAEDIPDSLDAINLKMNETTDEVSKLFKLTSRHSLQSEQHEHASRQTPRQVIPKT